MWLRRQSEMVSQNKTTSWREALIPHFERTNACSNCFFAHSLKITNKLYEAP